MELCFWIVVWQDFELIFISSLCGKRSLGLFSVCIVDQLSLILLQVTSSDFVVIWNKLMRNILSLSNAHCVTYEVSTVKLWSEYQMTCSHGNTLSREKLYWIVCWRFLSGDLVRVLSSLVLLFGLNNWQTNFLFCYNYAEAGVLKQVLHF
jgi:hypothetical protein